MDDRGEVAGTFVDDVVVDVSRRTVDDREVEVTPFVVNGTAVDVKDSETVDEAVVNGAGGTLSIP